MGDAGVERLRVGDIFLEHNNKIACKNDSLLT